MAHSEAGGGVHTITVIGLAYGISREVRLETGNLFYGNSSECRRFLRGQIGFYVYLLRRPEGRPFYVGKGVNDRALQHETEAHHPNSRKSNCRKLNVIRSIWGSDEHVVYEIDLISDDEQATYDREAELISAIGRLHEGGPLTNLAPGGGTAGGASPISIEKHAQTLGGIPENDHERAAINGFILGIADLASIIAKPKKDFIARPTKPLRKKPGGPTIRQAVALVASAAANGVYMDSECEIPRKLRIDGVEALIENGVASRILLTKMATVRASEKPEDEVFILTAEQCRVCAELIGWQKCYDLGVLRSVTL